MFVGCIELDKAEIGEGFFEGIEDNDSMELVYLNLLMDLEVVSPVSAVENEQNQESMAEDEGNILLWPRMREIFSGSTFVFIRWW